MKKLYFFYGNVLIFYAVCFLICEIDRINESDDSESEYQALGKLWIEKNRNVIESIKNEIEEIFQEHDLIKENFNILKEAYSRPKKELKNNVSGR